MKSQFFVFMVCCIFNSIVFSSEEVGMKIEPEVSVGNGAQVFSERCVLCHGRSGIGDGILPMRIKNYPNTNLVTGGKTHDRKGIEEAIVYGGTKGVLSVYMPPMGGELTWADLESVVSFVQLLRSDRKAASKMLENTEKYSVSPARLGQHIFEFQCSLCHGKYGEGDGRMQRVIKNPPPANLTLTKQGDEYIHKVIALGGAAMGRSKHMPPWGGELNTAEIDAVVIYIKSLRVAP